MNYHFIGIGGKGMSAIAQYLKERGSGVRGSDRYYDKGKQMVVFEKLMNQGIKIYPQDGTGIDKAVDRVIISSAIEENNKDLLKARALGIPWIKRALILAEIFNEYQNSLAVAGTSGKTTVAGMLATILCESGLKPTTFLGGELINNYQPWFAGNLLVGSSEYMCIEADESDGTVVHYKPRVGVLTNISKDHHEVVDLVPLFQKFLDNIKETLIINGDCSICNMLKYSGKVITFGFSSYCKLQATEVTMSREVLQFKVNGVKFRLNQWGRHNVENALAAIGAALTVGLELEEISRSLRHFEGMKRRLELVREVGGVSFFDDYAHNPKKIEASITALQKSYKRLTIILQCHGYQPTSFMWKELVDTFVKTCRKQDKVWLLPIYDEGGTANRNVNTADLAAALKVRGVAADHFSYRKVLKKAFIKTVKTGEAVLMMGARDETLSEFICELADAYDRMNNIVSL